MRKIRIAQIGINQFSHSLEILGSLNRQTELFEFVGYALPENEKERIPQKYEKLENYRELTLDEILKDPSIEAVAIETDEIYLTKYALLAAKAGKHIHMEKPGGIALADFEELISIMKTTGKVFHTGYMYRYNPYVRDILERVKNGELGKILSVDAQMSCRHGKVARQWLQELPGGMMFYLGCHLVDLILQIQGKPKKIIPLNKCTGYNVENTKDFGMAVFVYENGVSTAKTSAMEVGGYARRQLVVSGTKGTIQLEPFEMYTPEQKIYTGKTEYWDPAWNHMGEHSQTPLFNRYDGMMAGFASFVRGEEENPYDPDYELTLYKTVLECCKEEEE